MHLEINNREKDGVRHVECEKKTKELELKRRIGN